MLVYKNQIIYSAIYNGRRCFAARDIISAGEFYIGNAKAIILYAKMVEGQDYERINNLHEMVDMARQLGFEGKIPARFTVFYESGIEKYTNTKNIKPAYKKWLEDNILNSKKELNNNNIVISNPLEVIKPIDDSKSLTEDISGIEEDLDIKPIIDFISNLKDKMAKHERTIKNLTEMVENLTDKLQSSNIENEMLKRSANNLRKQILDLKTMLYNNNVV